MPRFFFHICNGHGFVEDEEGVELPDAPAVRRNAVEAARDVMAGDLREGRLDLTSFIEVEDEAHRLLFTLTFAEAVTVNSVPDPARPRPPR
jgi:hypothetical protein